MNDLKNEINEIITDSSVFARRCIVRNGFVFTAITHPANIYDAIVIKWPHDVPCFSPQIEGSLHTLEEHIQLINDYQIEKAFIISDCIDFITRCPSLKHIRIVPADNAPNQFDYSPLYEMHHLKSVNCATVYGMKEELSTVVDYARMIGVESISVGKRGHENFNQVKTLKSLAISGYKGTDLNNLFCSPTLDSIVMVCSKNKTLDGIDRSKNMQCLYFYYNRNLHDISALQQVKSSLKALRIENCPNIEDFSVLGELENLELLELTGSNHIESLSFLNNMKNLRTFVFDMNVMDGNLTPCLRLEYAASLRNRKHYNLKDKDLPKGAFSRGNDGIELWRRKE